MMVRLIKGEFKNGAPVSIEDSNNIALGIGLVTYNADEARLIIGCKSTDISDVLGYSRGKALIHRHNLALNQA